MVSGEFAMRIAIVGAGYVGLITGISLANLGHTVFCIEQNKDKVSIIQKGKSPFYEPNADNYLQKLIEKKLLHVTNSLEENIRLADVIIIAVGTPTIKNRIDLSAIKEAAKQIGKVLKRVRRYQVVAVKSTVLPGVTEEIIRPILEKYSDKKTGEFGLVMNPEFLREGSALEDAMQPDRIIIGQIDEKSGKTYAKIFIKLSTPIIFTNLWTAEMTKYAANALFATLISYANEIAKISENTGRIDILDVWRGVHLDKRLTPTIGKIRIKPGILSYIFSGCGFGGSCFPKDIQALSSFANQMGIEAELIKSVIKVNKAQPERIIFLLKAALGQNLSRKKIAVLGLAFKPDTDDTRESVAFPVIKSLLAEKATVICHDPKAYIPPLLNNLPVVFTKNLQEAIDNTDAVIIITAWKEYINLTPYFFKENMKQPVIIDGRRIYNKDLFLAAGVTYKGIGYNI